MNIPLMHKAIKAVFAKVPFTYELLFINDSSSDDSVKIIKRLQRKDKKVQLIDLARNFGKEAALTAGLHDAKGAAAIMLDADLQHPPKYIPTFITKWQKGAEVVVGVRKDKHGEAWFKRIGSTLFYTIINSISEIEITPHATDYRLLDRIVIDEFNRFSERNRITRGLIDWLGFRRDYVYFTPNLRMHGEPAYNLRKLIYLAIDSMVSMSLLPLKLAGYLGAFITLISGALGLFIFIENYVLGDPWNLEFSGPAILAVIILFLVGIILISLGLIAMYIARIHAEVANRPLYVRRHTK